MSDDRIHWQSIQQMKWSDKHYDDVVAFVKIGAYPTKDGVEITSSAKQKWRKRYKPFAWRADKEKKVNDDEKRGGGEKDDEKKEERNEGRLVLVLDKAEDVKWAVDKEGNKLIDVKLPIMLTVVKESDRDEVLKELYAELTENAYRSVDTFYERLSKQFVGITRDYVAKFMERVELL